MNFKLAVIGHVSSLEEIEYLVKHKFTNIDVHKIELNNDEDVEMALSKLTKIMSFCDGILYTRMDPYKLLSSRIEHKITTKYIDIDNSNFIHSLLQASYHFDVDIKRVSVDTLDYDSIMNAYKSLNIPIDMVSPRIVYVDTNSSYFVRKVQEEHLKNFKEGLCEVCLTNIRSVCDYLTENAVPCVLIAPSTETYIYEIRKILLSDKLKKLSGNKIVSLYIAASPSNEFYIYNNTVLQEAIELNKVAETIAFFAQKIDGALITISNKEFMLICDNCSLENATDNFSKIDILSSICTNTSHVLSVGIGYGDSIKTAKTNSELGLYRAKKEGGNRAYLVYSPDNIVGPLEPNEQKEKSPRICGERLVKIAEASGLSINTIFKIDCIIKQRNNRNFTSREIASELGISLRTANRIVAKLDACGYTSEVGKHVIKEKGRPSRMIKVLF